MAPGAGRSGGATRARRATPAPLVVELVGLPGSGKTTVGGALVAEVRSAGLLVHSDLVSPAGAPRGPVRWLVRRPGLAGHRLVRVAVAALWRSPRPLRDKREALGALLATLAARLDAGSGRAPADVLLLTEGLFQRAFLLLVDRAGCAPPWLVRAYARAVPPPDLVLRLSAEVDALLARLAGRTRKLPRRLAGMDGDRVRRLLGEADGLLDAVCRPGTGSAPVPLLSLDSTDLGRAVARALREGAPAILALARGWRRPGA
jgi:hypothetical protein